MGTKCHSQDSLESWPPWTRRSSVYIKSVGILFLHLLAFGRNKFVMSIHTKTIVLIVTQCAKTGDTPDLWPEDLNLLWYLCRRSSHDLRKEFPNAVCHTMPLLYWLPLVPPGNKARPLMWPFLSRVLPTDTPHPLECCGTLIIAPRVGTLAHVAQWVLWLTLQRQRQINHYSSE